jgi:hypothetical protein
VPLIFPARVINFPNLLAKDLPGASFGFDGVQKRSGKIDWS